MRKKYSFLIILLSLSFLAKAEPVSESNILKAATNFFVRNLPSNTSQLRASSDVEPQIVWVEKDSDRAYYYTLKELHTGAWVVLSADDAVDPVFAYSNSGSWGEKINPTFQLYLDAYKSSIRNQVENPSSLRSSSAGESKRKWDDLLNESTLRSSSAATAIPVVDYLLRTSDGSEITWSQRNNFPDESETYNLRCPIDNGQHALTGCVATAMGILVKYWGDRSGGTIQGSRDFSYIDPTYGLQSVDYSAQTYHTSLMPPYLFSEESGKYTYNNKPLFQSTAIQNDEVAKLLYHCGVAVRTEYTPNESGAVASYVSGALSTFFGFGKATDLSRKYYSVQEWNEILKRELNEGRPVFYSGNSAIVGHAFILDGYDSNGFFHINWGMGMNGQNGFVDINALNNPDFAYNIDQAAIIHIEPDKKDFLQVLNMNVTGKSNATTLGDNVCVSPLSLNWFSAMVYNPTSQNITAEFRVRFGLGKNLLSYYLQKLGTVTIRPGEIKNVTAGQALVSNEYSANEYFPVTLFIDSTSYEIDYANVLPGVPNKVSINRQPKNQTVNSNTPAVFKVYAQGKNVKYQWYKNGSKLIGKTANPLLIADAQASDAGRYTCVVSDDNSTSVTSDEAVLHVVNNSTGITEITDGTEESFVFPTVTQDFIQVKTGIGNNIIVYDMLGRSLQSKLATGDETMIDMSSYRSGIYLIKANGKSMKVIKK